MGKPNHPAAARALAAFILLAPIAALPSFAVSAAAQEANPNIISVNRGISLSYLNTYLDYIEPSGANAVIAQNHDGTGGTGYEDYEQGNITGARIAASWMTRDLWYFAAEWQGSTGQVQYTGFAQDGNTNIPILQISRATIQDYDFKFGRGFATGRNWMLTPYLSFGGHHWTRELSLGTPGDFDEAYNHYYLAAGSLVQYAVPARALVLTANAEIGRTIAPTINVPPDLDNAPLGVSPLIKLGLEADYRLAESLHMFTGIDYTYFTYGQSGVQLVQNYLVVEPYSRTQLVNYTIGLRFAFDNSF